MPELAIQFYQFANVNNTIRLRDGRLLVRISDLLETAPGPILLSLAHILLAKLYSKPIQKLHSARYRRYISAKAFKNRVHLIRQVRGRKAAGSPQGEVYNLEEIFEDLNVRFFHGLLALPQLTWSQVRSRCNLGHYDPAHNTIVISKVFDLVSVPKLALEYLIYHEMLHLRHPVRLRGSRRCVHPKSFVEEEKLFPELEKAKEILKRF